MFLYFSYFQRRGIISKIPLYYMNQNHSILQIVRQHLQRENIPPEEQAWLLSLCALCADAIPPNTNAIAAFIRALLDRRHLLSVIRQQSAELEALRRISLNLTAHLELPEVLQTVAAEAMRLIKDAREVHIYLYDRGKLAFGATLDRQGTKNRRLIEPRPQGLSYQVIQNKEIVVVEDMRNHPLFANTPKESDGSIISIPLIAGSQVVGVMNLTRPSTGGFSQAEIALLRLLADQAAIAISNARLHEAVSQQAYTDILTGLPNRRALDQRLEEEVKRASRSGHPLSVVMMDLDGFKHINDHFGHAVGDEVLRQAFGNLKHHVRTTDFLARYGGDEITLILPETTLEQARVVVSKLQRRLRATAVPLPDGSNAILNLTGGIAVMPNHARTAPDLLRAADEALYRAKRHQRGTFLAAKPGTGQLPTL